jgi:hypothetical protein
VLCFVVAFFEVIQFMWINFLTFYVNIYVKTLTDLNIFIYLYVNIPR